MDIAELTRLCDHVPREFWRRPMAWVKKCPDLMLYCGLCFHRERRFYFWAHDVVLWSRNMPTHSTNRFVRQGVTFWVGCPCCYCFEGVCFPLIRGTAFGMAHPDFTRMGPGERELTEFFASWNEQRPITGWYTPNVG